MTQWMQVVESNMLCKEIKETGSGEKHDQGKPPMGLMPRMPLEQTAQVLAFGARKYAAHNWRGGLLQSRTIDATLRHIYAYNEGEDLDEETGLNHLAHAICELMFTLENLHTHPEMDDRYKAS